MKKIVLTGGGTAGHVITNIALLKPLKEKGYDVYYIGSYHGIERSLIEAEGVRYYPISSGKLRRYFDVKNFTDPFRVIKGLFQSVRILRKIKPNVLFSKGGFVSVPVVIAAKMVGVPVVIHESDMTPGLANKIASKYAKKVCCNFPETCKHITGGKGIFTGSPVRKELFEGDMQKAKVYCKFTEDKPTLLIMGGSSGAKRINDGVRNILDKLLESFNIIHLCGKGHLDRSLEAKTGYLQKEYVREELKDLLALSDVVISRAGANTIGELLALKKPNILIPLPLSSSRGDQILNANSFEKQGFSVKINQEDLTDELLLSTLDDVYKNREVYIDNMNKHSALNSEKLIIDIIEATRK